MARLIESLETWNNVANILNDQKCQTEQIATAINQMSSTVQEIAQVVATASTSAQESLDISNDGQRYEPVNMPEQLKYEGRSVSITAKKSNGFSLFMWGTPIYITAFHTL